MHSSSIKRNAHHSQYSDSPKHSNHPIPISLSRHPYSHLRNSAGTPPRLTPTLTHPSQPNYIKILI